MRSAKVNVSAKFKIHLNPKDIGRVIKDIKNTKELKAKIELLIKKSLKYGVEIAKAQVRELGAKYSELEKYRGLL